MSHRLSFPLGPMPLRQLQRITPRVATTAPQRSLHVALRPSQFARLGRPELRASALSGSAIRPVRYASSVPPNAGTSAGGPASSGSPPPSKAKFAQVVTTINLTLIGLLLIGTGYAIGTSGTSTTSSSSSSLSDSTLLPSNIAIPRQEASQPTYGSLQDYHNLIGELKHIWSQKGKGDKVSVDKEDLQTHGISDWSYHEAKPPTVVVWAESTEEVQEIVLLARKWRVPITPFSGGTSLEGHYSSPYGGISLDLSLMDKVLKISPADGDAVVQSGVKWEDLNAHLVSQGHQLFFPLDPGPGATIGGMAGTGCSGTNAVRYGTAKAEWFLNLTVVLPSGEIIKTRQRARKSAAGWDATKLFIGAEGTLGIVTEATVRLTPLLPTKCAVVTFDGVASAVKAATEVVNAGFPVQCVEFLDAKTMKAINQGGLTGRTYKEAATLFFKFQGNEDQMATVAKGVQVVTRQNGGANFEFSKSEKEAADLWQGRKAALWSVLALVDGAKVWTTDVCVPISRLPQLVKETTDDFEKRGITACHFGHVGDGNVHSLALFSTPEELEVVKEAVHEMVHRAIRLDGTCTGEHGVGIGKIEYLDEELGRGTVNVMETVKRTLDPLNLFNPGKVYPHIIPKPTAGVEAEAAAAAA